MAVLIASGLWALTVAGLLARAILQYRHFRVIGPDERPDDAAPASPPKPRVAIIVPARDEAANIGRCLASLLAQDYPANAWRIIVVDDNSRDATASIVESIAQRDGRVALVRGAALPAGWAGKPYACRQAAELAGGEVDWLCFIDADVTARPALLRTAMRAAHDGAIDLLSLQPFQELGTAWERLILPTGFFLLAFTQDVRQTSDPASPAVAVNGQFLLARRSAYEAIGGHAAVRDALAEDSALAAAFKRGGFRVSMLGTHDLLSTRMYRSLGPLWDGLARQAGQLLRGRAALLIAAAAAAGLAAVPIALPLWAWSAWHGGRAGTAAAGLALSLAGSLALLGTHIGAARYFRVPFWYGALFPVGYVLGTLILLHALGQRTRGQVRWKGRDLAVAAPGPIPMRAEASSLPAPVEHG